MGAEGAKIWDGQAVTGTTTYYSRVVEPSEGGLGIVWHHFNKTGDAAGALTLQINLRPKKQYEQNVAAAAGATYALKEAANTAGWVDTDLSPSDSVAVPGGTDPFDEPIRLTSMTVRHRWKYVNASGTGTITDLVQVA